MFASDRGHTAVVAKLLSCGADPELHKEKVVYLMNQLLLYAV